MFALYRDAAKCYAYLTDVSTGSLDDSYTASELCRQENWTMSFRRSQWFTRGWTLQELLAPGSVEFFPVDGQRLGDKLSLCQEVVEATGIPFEALEGGYRSLLRFSVNERLSWAAGSETKREEDAAYSLLGCLDLAIPLIYGQGRERAFRRLHREREIASAYEKDLIEKNSGKNGEFDAFTGGIRKSPLRKTASQAFDSSPEDHASGSPEKPEETEEDTLERQTELMQTCWDEAVAEYADPPDEYRKVAVLLLKWRDQLDEREVCEEVCEQFTQQSPLTLLLQRLGVMITVI